jgi:hypothetical protein
VVVAALIVAALVMVFVRRVQQVGPAAPVEEV